MLEDKLRLQEQADSLSQRLEAILHDKFERKSFDADTPIDKTLAYLESVIQVHHACLVAVGRQHALISQRTRLSILRALFSA